MAFLKYKPLRLRTITDPLDPKRTIKARQWKAMCDLPFHNVVKGALTGYIGEDVTINQDSNVWVTQEAVVYGAVKLSGNARIFGSAIVRGPKNYFGAYGHLKITDNVVISGFGVVVGWGEWETYLDGPSVISGYAEISRAAKVALPRIITGQTIITDFASVDVSVIFRDQVQVGGYAYVGEQSELNGCIILEDASRIGSFVKVEGLFKLDGNTVLKDEIYIKDGNVIQPESVFHKVTETTPELAEIIKSNKGGSNLNYAKVNSFAEAKLDTESGDIDALDSGFEDVEDLVSYILAMPTLEASLNTAIKPPAAWINRFNEVKASIKSYESDIVKVIKYPIMVDLRDAFTAEMVFALKNTERALLGSNDDFAICVAELEKRFLVAESNALRLAGKSYTDKERKKTEQAQDLFAIAYDENASENERRIAFKQGFKQLEGIIAVPEIAIETTKVKMGLKQLEM